MGDYCGDEIIKAVWIYYLRQLSAHFLFYYLNYTRTYLSRKLMEHYRADDDGVNTETIFSWMEINVAVKCYNY